MRSSWSTPPRCYMLAEDYPNGVAPETIDTFVEMFRTEWGTSAFAAAAAPRPGQR